jgi:SPP1 family predicted phage head-tail adaptor
MPDAYGAGALDRQLQFRRATLADNGLEAVETWADHGTPVWAAKKDVSDGERLRAQEVQAHITSRFTVRWSPFTAGITPKDRLICEGREHDIAGIKEAGTRRQWLEITAAARADK